MKVFKETLFWSLFLILALVSPLSAQEDNAQNVQKCRSFVQGFYDWYVPKALRDTDVPASDLAIRIKSSSFSSELLRALREDSQAQAKARGEIVGLDFDPFLNTQDPGKRYAVGNITPKGDRYWVEVFRMSAGRKGAKPEVVPEVMLKDGRCIFVNFHYGKSKRSEDENLISTLKALEANRLKYPK